MGGSGGGSEKGRLSRRGLFDIFGRGLREARDAAKDVARDAAAARGGQGAPAPVKRPAAPSFPRKLRPPGECLGVTLDAAGRIVLDLSARPVATGGSLKLACASLAEPLLFVRVSESHWATVTGECPVDGSDLLWHGGRDCAWCPACGSQWRLDGEVLRGPARDPLVSCHTDVLEDRARIVP